MNPVRPTSPTGVVTAVTELIATHDGRVRVAVDGADVADPAGLADAVVAAVPSRRIVHVRASTFWRQAALRLEQGRHDEDAWLDGWLDEAALRREVLDIDKGRVLPALRDPLTDRALRVEPVDLPPNGVVLVSGAALLGRGLPFEVSVHLHLSSAALARRTPLDESWILPALERYESERAPDASADIVVRWDDPAHPACLVR